MVDTCYPRSVTYWISNSYRRRFGSSPFYLYNFLAHMTKNRRKNIEAILAISTGLLLLYLIFKIEGFIIAAFIVSLVSLLFGIIADGIGWLWLTFAKGLGFVMGNILLTIVFFVFLTPVALISKLFRKDLLLLKRKPRSSFYFSRQKTFGAEDFENMW